ncbi:MAG: hypothetical protein COU81_02470 [Candidatus Portnoybacteria bacterium CG10_big_fil_rev_8_21_14_0_10_36_7]|uniref:Uncharacterized protein n=1 Tax=Candidatus Portnoybacteria bacterium CG10_big_fil_rev_8_21_14_0_10_36_7 TaxID=1974812 RepID=A0A2M8KDW6_9BACT|nr:MAG: hypothetical protein COU81_02470 [Candidatus Portnoybacteria bacterium CG10_big_fil_rev_8_21_14_0_10_36_7]
MKLILSKSKGMVGIMILCFLVIFEIAFLFGSSYLGLNERNSAKNFYESVSAKYLASSCAQDALLKLSNDINYGGDEILNVGDGQCETLAIINSGGEQRTIQIQSTVGGAIKKVQVEVLALIPNIVIGSWDESPNF